MFGPFKGGLTWFVLFTPWLHGQMIGFAMFRGVLGKNYEIIFKKIPKGGVCYLGIQFPNNPIFLSEDSPYLTSYVNTHLSEFTQSAKLHNASELFPASPWIRWDQVKTRWAHLRLSCSSTSLLNLTCSSSSCFLTSSKLYDEMHKKFNTFERCWMDVTDLKTCLTCFSSSTKLPLLLCTDHLSITLNSKNHVISF